MCRFYRTKQGPGYTRLCYRTGRRGERIPGNAIPPGKSHVMHGSLRRAVSPDSYCRRCGRRWHVERFRPVCDPCLTKGG